MKKKIILNCLPPASIYSPSPGLSILKGFMQDNKYDVEIKYWNIILEKFSKHFANNKDKDVLQLLPFYISLIDEFNDTIAEKRIFSLIHSINPFFVFNNADFESIKKLLIKQKSEIIEIIEKELSLLESNEILCFGFTSKFFQWIPAMFFANIIKRIFPKIKIVIGGFETKDSAKEILSISHCFDYSFWVLF